MEGLLPINENHETRQELEAQLVALDLLIAGAGGHTDESQLAEWVHQRDVLDERIVKLKEANQEPKQK